MHIIVISFFNIISNLQLRLFLFARATSFKSEDSQKEVFFNQARKKRFLAQQSQKNHAMPFLLLYFFAAGNAICLYGMSIPIFVSSQ